MAISKCFRTVCRRGILALLTMLFCLSVFSPIANAAFANIGNRLPDDNYKLKLPNGTEASPNGDDCYISSSIHGDCTAFSFGVGNSHQYITLSQGVINDSTRDADFDAASAYISILSPDKVPKDISVDLVERAIKANGCEAYVLNYDYFNTDTMTIMSSGSITATGCTNRSFKQFPTSGFSRLVTKDTAGNDVPSPYYKGLIRITIAGDPDRQASFHINTNASAALGYAGRLDPIRGGPATLESEQPSAGLINTYPTNAADGHRIAYTFRPSCDIRTGQSVTFRWRNLDYPSIFQPVDMKPIVELYRQDGAGGNRKKIATYTDLTNTTRTILMNKADPGQDTFDSQGRPWQFSLEFSGIRGGNGVSFDQPYDSALAKLECPTPPPPVGSIGGACHSATVNNGDGRGAGETYTTPGGAVYNTNTIVNITNVSPGVSGGYTNGGGGFGNGHVGFGASRTWTYDPTATSINVSSYRIYHNTSTGKWGKVPGSDTSQDITCFVAQCFINQIIGDGPGGIVLAGGTAHLAIQINNNPSFQPLPDPYPTDGSRLGILIDGVPTVPPSANLGYGLNPGGDGIVYLDLGMPPGASVYTFNAVAAYIGGFVLSGPCAGPTSFPTYERFNLEPYADISMTPTEEDPTNIFYHTWVVNTRGRAVFSPVHGRFTVQPSGGAINNINAADPAQAWNPGPTDVQIGNYPPTSVKAGDQYCANLSIDYATGFIGPGGPTDIVPTGGASAVPACRIIHNKPYFRVLGNNISSGGEFTKIETTGGCAEGGTLGGWNNNLSGGRSGSATQLATLALTQIKGVASGQYSAGTGGRLSFANNNGPGALVGSDLVSPNLGGTLRDKQCIPTPEPPATPAGTPIAGPSIGGASPSGTTVYTHTGNLTITSGSVGAGSNAAIYVTGGDVFIANNITYTPGPWAANRVPSFQLVVTGGNIYIAPGVTQLDGVYTAQNTAPGGTKGRIYTCAAGSGFAPRASAEQYDACKNQLTVNGSFVANDVRLMRTFGSLRDDRLARSPTSSAIPFFGGYALPPTPHALAHVNLYRFTKGGTEYYTTNPGDFIPFVLTGTGWSFSLTPIVQIRPPTGALPGGRTIPFYRFQSAPGALPSATYAYGNSLAAKPAAFTGPSTLLGYLYTDPNDPAIAAAIPPIPPVACSNQGLVSSPFTCAAEVFNFSPELYLSTPAVKTPNNGGIHFDAITSLPPIL